MAHVFVSIGSNIDRYRHIVAALDALTDEFGALQLSRVYESEAVGFDGDNFLNLVAGFTTDLSVGALNRLLHAIEDRHGRRRDVARFSARTLDIDILTYDDQVGCIDGVELPREEILKNAFVLLPLVDVAAEQLHPVLQRSYRDLWRDYDQNSQPLWPVEFRWGRLQLSN